MSRAACCVAALALSGCGGYAGFTLPAQPGGDLGLAFQFDESPAPVLADSAGDALNPSVVSGSGLTNLYSVYSSGVWTTAAAASSDGRQWQPQGAVLRPDAATWEGNYIAANGAALSDGGRVLYWYVAGPRNAGSIGLARAQAGSLQFEKRARPVLSHGPFDSWDERAVADPYVIREGDYLYMYYLGQDRAQPPQQRIGVARSRDGIAWEKLRSNPILTPGPPGAFDEAGDGEPAVWHSHGFYWMLFTGRNFSERRRLGLARSTRWRSLDAARRRFQRRFGVGFAGDLRPYCLGGWR